MTGVICKSLEELQNFCLTEPTGKRAKEGDSPVSEKQESLLVVLLSTAGPEKSCGNLRGPSRKAKYYSVTDSEQVP